MNEIVFWMKALSDEESFTEAQKEALQMLEKGGEYLSLKQASAVMEMLPMTQEIFDSIMALRGDVGAELEELMWYVYFKYEKYADVYAEKLMKMFPLDENFELAPESDRKHSAIRTLS